MSGKLSFTISAATADGPTLAGAFAGDVGTVHLGPGGVALWKPGMELTSTELVCDLRGTPTDAFQETAFQFGEALKRRFATARACLLEGNAGKQRTQAAKDMFNYVLVPDTEIKNTPADLRNRVLSYYRAGENWRRK